MLSLANRARERELNSQKRRMWKIARRRRNQTAKVYSALCKHSSDSS